MKITIKALILYSTLFWTGCKPSTETKSEFKKVNVELKNESNTDRLNTLVHIDAKLLKKYFPKGISNLAVSNNIPYQLNDLDGDGVIDQLSLMSDFNALENKTISFKLLPSNVDSPKFEKRTQAEISHKVNGTWQEREYIGGEFKNVDYLKVPEAHTDHSWFIRYEGPGIESDLVGYRFYLDWRNAVDVFGKKSAKMVLQDVGLDGFDSYHEPSNWGMDILKVGKSLGLGSIGFWNGENAVRVEKTDSLDCRIVLNGDVESMVRTRYFGWEIDNTKTTLTSELSMHAGSRLVKNTISLSQPISNLCTGIVKHEKAELLKGGNQKYRYLATWGKQSLAEDLMGMAVIYRASDEGKITEDDYSDVVVLNPQDKRIDYYYLATWEQGVSGIKSKMDFIELLNQKIENLTNPIVVNPIKVK